MVLWETFTISLKKREKGKKEEEEKKSPRLMLAVFKTDRPESKKTWESRVPAAPQLKTPFCFSVTLWPLISLGAVQIHVDCLNKKWSNTSLIQNSFWIPRSCSGQCLKSPFTCHLFTLLTDNRVGSGIASTSSLFLYEIFLWHFSPSNKYSCFLVC